MTDPKPPGLRSGRSSELDAPATSLPKDESEPGPVAGHELEVSADPERGSIFDMPMSSTMRERLVELRRALLNLHKDLLHGEKLDYEREYGVIQGVTHYLNLVMTDAHFDWLHRISELIVQMDETLDDKEAGMKVASDLFVRANILFHTSLTGDDSDFMIRYKANLKRNPGAILAHAQVRRALLSDA